MSFSSDVKKEITDITNENECCKKALMYGLTLFGRSFNADNVSAVTDNDLVADFYKRSLEKNIGITVTRKRKDSGKNFLSIDREEDRKKLFSYFNLTGREPSLRINRSNLTNEADDEENCCFCAFLRGVFLICGTVCDPQKMYTLEFSVQFKRLTDDFITLLEEMELKPKVTQRRGAKIIYFKDSGQIEEVLGHMNAVNSMLEIVGIKAWKNMRNKANRQTNFDTANIARVVNASANHIRAIEYIEKTKGLDYLPDDLREIAVLRRDNPDFSLRELGESCEKPITRSAVNFKLTKILSAYKSLLNEEEQEKKQ